VVREYLVHRTARVRRHGLVLVECPWAVMRLAQLRLPAVALLGTHLSDHQARLLADVPRLLLMLDGDPAGRTAAPRIYRRLTPHAAVSVARLPEGLVPTTCPTASWLPPPAASSFLDQCHLQTRREMTHQNRVSTTP